MPNQTNNTRKQKKMKITILRPTMEASNIKIKAQHMQHQYKTNRHTPTHISAINKNHNKINTHQHHIKGKPFTNVLHTHGKNIEKSHQNNKTNACQIIHTMYKKGNETHQYNCIENCKSSTCMVTKQ